MPHLLADYINIAYAACEISLKVTRNLVETSVSQQSVYVQTSHLGVNQVPLTQKLVLATHRKPCHDAVQELHLTPTEI